MSTISHSVSLCQGEQMGTSELIGLPEKIPRGGADKTCDGLAPHPGRSSTTTIITETGISSDGRWGSFCSECSPYQRYPCYPCMLNNVQAEGHAGCSHPRDLGSNLSSTIDQLSNDINYWIYESAKTVKHRGESL